MLKIQNISKTFNSKHILTDVSLTLNKGEVVLLLGASGVGKSTLLRILNNLEQADSGTITYNGQPLNKETMHTKHLVGMIFQQFNLFPHLSVEENITLAMEKGAKASKSDAKKRAHELLRNYGLLDKAQLAVSQLSGGQKQRLSIARALALKPQIICMDEPTSSLDPLLTNAVAGHIQSLAKEGYSVLVATHDMRLVEVLEGTVHLMDNGRIIESATIKRLREKPNEFPALSRFAYSTTH